MDDIIVFNSLTREHLAQIIDIQLANVGKTAEGPRAQAGSHPGGQGHHHRGGLRSAVRRAADAARDPAADPGSAGAASSSTATSCEGDTIVVDVAPDDGSR